MDEFGNDGYIFQDGQENATHLGSNVRQPATSEQYYPGAVLEKQGHDISRPDKLMTPEQKEHEAFVRLGQVLDKLEEYVRILKDAGAYPDDLYFFLAGINSDFSREKLGWHFGPTIAAQFERTGRDKRLQRNFSNVSKNIKSSIIDHRISPGKIFDGLAEVETAIQESFAQKMKEIESRRDEDDLVQERYKRSRDEDGTLTKIRNWLRLK